VLESLHLEYYTSLGPGAGFFPLWLGASLGGLALVWLAQISGRAGKPEEGAFLPRKTGLLQILSILAALLATAVLMNLIGFQLTMFLFMVFLLMVPGRQKILIAVIIALLCSVGVYHVFGSYLDVPLPAASVDLLARLGL
jgi:putative tricarboxylic transport membrane protein